MVATSLQEAKNLVQLCFTERNQRLTCARQVLIGKGDTHALTEAEKTNLAQCLSNLIDDNNLENNLCIVDSYRSAYIPGTVTGGTHYQIGDNIIAEQNNMEVVIKILHFYLLHINHQYIPIIFGDCYVTSKDTDQNDLRHPFSDTAIVEPYATKNCVCLLNVKRKIMLYPFQASTFAIMDPSRPHIPLPQVLVPVYPQIGDMVYVKGDEEDLWRVEIKTVGHVLKVACGHYFVKHRFFEQNALWVRETRVRLMSRILYKSITGILAGQWHGAVWKDT